MPGAAAGPVSLSWFETSLCYAVRALDFLCRGFLCFRLKRPLGAIRFGDDDTRLFWGIASVDYDLNTLNQATTCRVCEQ